MSRNKHASKSTNKIKPPKSTGGPELAAPSTGMPVKLDIACGEIPADGFDGVDLYAPSAKYKVNLLRFPWTDENTGVQIESDTVDEVYCSHFLEHLPSIMTSVTGAWVDPTECASHHKHMFFRWFEELWRIMKVGAVATFYVPAARHHRGFQDPTHTSFYVPERFLYLNTQWRALNKLEHAYNTSVHFDVVSVDPMGDASLGLLHEEVRNRKFVESWNVITDYKAILRKAVWTPPEKT